MQEIETFKTHLITLGYSHSTVEQQTSCLKQFVETIQKPLNTVSPEDIKNYYQYLQNRPHQRKAGGLSENYIHHHISSLKQYYKYTETTGETYNPISGLQFPSPTRKPRIILSQEEIRTLYQATETPKERAILSLYYGCGLRRTEGVQLSQQDLHLKEQKLYIREGKGKRRRVVPLSPQVKEDLKQYLEQERNPKPHTTTYLTNSKGEHTTGGTINKELKKLIHRAGINKDISLHSLRHSIATHLLERGLNIEKVRDYLGHKHLESTQHYTQVNQTQLNELNTETNAAPNNENLFRNTA